MELGFGPEVLFEGEGWYASQVFPEQCAQVSHPQTICLQIHVNVKNAWALPDFRERQVVSDRESLESLE